MLKLTALVMVCVLTVTFAVPAKAEAIDPLMAIGIATAAIGVLIVVIFLVVANVTDAKRSAVPVLYACVEAEGQPRTCWPMEQGSTAPLLVTPPPAPAPQS